MAVLQFWRLILSEATMRALSATGHGKPKQWIAPAAIWGVSMIGMLALLSSAEVSATISATVSFLAATGIVAVVLVLCQMVILPAQLAYGLRTELHRLRDLLDKEPLTGIVRMRLRNVANITAPLSEYPTSREHAEELFHRTGEVVGTLLKPHWLAEFHHQCGEETQGSSSPDGRCETISTFLREAADHITDDDVSPDF
jgi:hypothetical protein